MTHFGSSDDVEGQLDEVGSRLDAWAALARSSSEEEFIAAVHQEIADGTEPGLRTAYTQAAPPYQLYAGLARYWHKRAEAAELS
jgi:hypothetical protein